jgi:hypothetical protein
LLPSCCYAQHSRELAHTKQSRGIGSQVKSLHYVTTLYILTHVLPTCLRPFITPLTIHFCNMYIKSPACPPPISFF